jgi:hypothetical protein
MSREIYLKKRGITAEFVAFCTPRFGVPYINIPSGASLALLVGLFFGCCSEEDSPWA